MDYRLKSGRKRTHGRKATLKTGVFLGRKRFLINPAFQWKVVGFALVITFFLVLAFQLSNQYFLLELNDLGRDLQLPQDHFFFEVIASQRRKMGWVTLGVSCVTVLFSIGYGILFSHRIAGPLYRLRMHLDQQRKEKKLKPLHFREADFFQEIPESYNHMIESLESKE